MAILTEAMRGMLDGNIDCSWWGERLTSEEGEKRANYARKVPYTQLEATWTNSGYVSYD